MHELSIVCEMAKVVLQVKEEQNLKKVKAITLEIGELSDIIPDYLVECWKVVRDEYDFESTELKIERIKARVRCNICQNEFILSPNCRRCPNCQSKDYTVLCGREFLIKNIEAY